MTTGWLERVAAAAGVGVPEANAMLVRRGITPDRPLRPARRLTITSIAFSGEKRGRVTGPFAFDWADLGPGVWALASDGDNLVGKSTVLEILMWILRGEPKGLQDDVRGWLEHVSVGFCVDEDTYVVEFDLERLAPVGALYRALRKGKRVEIDKFSSNEGFTAAMSRFMMDALDLDPVPARQGGDEDGKTVNHGWAALSGAIYFGGDHKLLLGDVQWGGLPARMLQMYVGMPWARTLMHATTAQKEVAQEVAQARRAAVEAQSKAAEARKRLEGEVDAARQRLASLGNEAVTAEHLEEQAREVARLSHVLAGLEGRLAQARNESDVLRTIADEDERALRSLREDRLAARFFNGLNPTCCPRCDAGVGPDRRRREKETSQCSLCATPIAPDRAEEDNAVLDEAEQRRDASRTAAERAEAALARLEADRNRAWSQFNEARTGLAAAASGGSFRQRRDAELEVARLEGALRDRTEEPALVGPPIDAAVIEAAVAEAKSAFETARGDLLVSLNEEILRLGRDFGVIGLEEVKLNSQAQMQLRKGGQSTSFSKLVAGERLRLRIATAVALLRVGRTLGVGRHPGLIIIDSPGAEETSDHNLASLLRELNAVSAELAELQVFIASANAPAITTALDPTHCRVARRGGFLW
ncbi:hypothetical protein WME91_03095 [Sorangium sp. So ce269]